MNAPESVTANFVPATVQVTVGTSPPGLSFTVDSTTYTSTQTLTWNVGSSHTISTTSPQAGAPGTQFVFNNWSDGGAISHSVTAPSTATTYTATFDTQYQLTTAPNPSNGGTVSPSSGTFYAANTVVSLTATPNSGFAFSNWTGNVADPNSASTTVTMSAPQSVTANFVPDTTVQITVETNPAGLSFTVDSVTYTSTQTLTWSVGSAHTISTTSPQAGAPGTQSVFNNWSDGGAISHSVTAPSTATSYTLGMINYENSAISAYEDRFEHTFGNEFRYLVLPTTTLVGEYRYEIIDYDTAPNNSMTHFVLAGLDHSFDPHFNVSLRGGVQFREFENFDEQTSPYGEATLNYSLGERTTVSWSNRYGLDEPDVPGTASRTTFRTGLNASYAITPRIVSSLSIFYQHDDNDSLLTPTSFVPAFDEDSLDISLGLRYEINRNFAALAGYSHTEVFSDITLREYARNRYYLGLNASF
jgi:hypothetical protein